jgi:hypothetical protein
MAKAPSVVLERNGGMVRLRGIKWSLPVTLDTDKGRIRALIPPNRWTRVPDAVYEFLKGRFDKQTFTSIPDVEANERNPHKPGEAPIMTEEEVDPQFFLEFKD